MPSLELAAGQVLTAAHTNTYWMRQVVATGLSGSRPTGYEGRVVYDTDNDALNIYTTATTGWRPPWNLPWGMVGFAIASANTSTSSPTFVDVAGASVSWPQVAGRRYRIEADGLVVGTTAPDLVAALALADAGGLQYARPGRTDIPMRAQTTQYPFHVRSIYQAASTATKVAKLQIAALVGGTIQVWNNVGDVTISVTDVGPYTGPL